ncbi:MAG: hypothetical protein GX297_00690 [Treponema sp.]|nr:hypothetical protein [Treponema sp.]
MNKILEKIGLLFFGLSILISFCSDKFLNYSVSLIFFFDFLGCVFLLPESYNSLKKSDSGLMLRHRYCFAMTIVGATFCFALSIAFLPCFGL